MAGKLNQTVSEGAARTAPTSATLTNRYSIASENRNEEVSVMQRYISLAALLLFMLVFSFMALSFQKDMPPFQRKSDVELLYRERFRDKSLDPSEEDGSLNESSGIVPDDPQDEPDEEKPKAPEIVQPDEPEFNHEDAHKYSWPDRKKNDANVNPELTDRREQLTSNAAELEEALHFLLISRNWEQDEIVYITIVTLAPYSHAHLTTLNPDLPAPLKSGFRGPVKDMISRCGSYSKLVQTVDVITGLTPQFYIDLNMDGFFALTDILINANTGSSAALAKEANRLNPRLLSLDGISIMNYLTEPEIDSLEKEALLIMLLVTSRDVQDTSTGMKLLWTGYRNIKTDLGLQDLLDVRRITQKISPEKVTLYEIE